MSDTFFSFDDGVQEKKDANKKKIECTSRSVSFNPLAFLAKGVTNDINKEWMKYIYPIELEGKQYLASTNGHKIHYIPSEHKSLFEVGKIEKNSVTLYELKNEWASEQLKKGKSMVKVFPIKDLCIETECDFYQCSHHKEFFPLLLHKLSGGGIYFNFDYLATFIEYFSKYSFGIVKIIAPGNRPTNPWRFEYWAGWNNKELIYGMLIAPAAMPELILNAKDLYSTPKYTEAARQETVDVDENKYPDPEPETAPVDNSGDPDVKVETSDDEPF